MRLALAVAGVVALAGPVAAHPHVFMETELEVIRDEAGRAVSLRVTWSYDPFFSLVLITERGLDPDADGVLTVDEEAALQGFDMNWEPGFAGDVYAFAGDAAVALSGPRNGLARYEGGRIVSSHVRDLAAPVAGLLVVKNYDPTYYTEYTIRDVAAGGCGVEIVAPDLTEAELALKAALAELPADMDVETGFPEVGAAFAQEVRVTCAAS
ncbi:MAG: polyphosphate kinase [Rhodobacter sp. CACIA14H1]|nr:MAG: polyphosphate kinase [Rhodobacter sp. CACIA14H1]